MDHKNEEMLTCDEKQKRSRNQDNATDVKKMHDCQRGALSTGQINSKTLKNRIGWDILISLFQSFLTPNQALCLVVH